MPNALITGASAGLGYALAQALAKDGWNLVITARGAERLERVSAELSALTRVTALAGDVAESAHREQLVAASTQLGSLDLLINNASELGGSPPPALAELDPETHLRLFEVNVAAPLHLIRSLLPQLSDGAAVINISSDAAVEHYEGWGGYASTKAALDHLTLTLAAEQTQLRCYAVDPGDLRTEMHQAAFPGEDISDRPEPASVVPAFLHLITSDLPSGRYRATDLAEGALR